MACVELVIRVKCNIKSTVERIRYTRKEETGICERKAARKKGNINAYAVIMLSILSLSLPPSLSLCRSAHGYSLLYLLIRCVCVGVLSPFPPNLLFYFVYCQLDFFSLPCTKWAPSSPDGHTIRASHRFLQRPSKENMIIKNILFTHVVVGGGTAYRATCTALPPLSGPCFSPDRYAYEMR